MRTSNVVCALLGMAIVATSCGDSGAGGTCATMQPCGGDIVGNWTITASCTSFTLDLSATCPGLTSTGSTTNAGSLAYNADLTYVATTTVSGTVRYHYPSSCLSGRTCAPEQEALMTMGGFTTVTCQSSGGACDCDAVVMDAPNSESGTYSTAGGVLTTVHAGTTSQNKSSYCVTGNVLHEMPIPNPAVSGTATGTVTLSKP